MSRSVVRPLAKALRKHDEKSVRALSILVVDDEVDTRETLAALLAAEFPGCRVVSVEDGNSAMEAIDRTRFDLVIADYRLPGPNGLEVAAHARRAHRAKCVLITGYADPGFGAAEIQNGILLGILHKTASSGEILAFLKRAVGQIDR